MGSGYAKGKGGEMSNYILWVFFVIFFRAQYPDYDISLVDGLLLCVAVVYAAAYDWKK